MQIRLLSRRSTASGNGMGARGDRPFGIKRGGDRRAPPGGRPLSRGRNSPASLDIGGEAARRFPAPAPSPRSARDRRDSGPGGPHDRQFGQTFRPPRRTESLERAQQRPEVRLRPPFEGSEQLTHRGVAQPEARPATFRGRLNEDLAPIPGVPGSGDQSVRLQPIDQPGHVRRGHSQRPGQRFGGGGTPTDEEPQDDESAERDPLPSQGRPKPCRERLIHRPDRPVDLLDERRVGPRPGGYARPTGGTHLTPRSSR